MRQIGFGINCKAGDYGGKYVIKAFKTKWILDYNWHVISVETAGRYCSYSKEGDYIRVACDGNVKHAVRIMKGLVVLPEPVKVIKRDIRGTIARDVMLKGTELTGQWLSKTLGVSLWDNGCIFKVVPGTNCIVGDNYTVCYTDTGVFVYESKPLERYGNKSRVVHNYLSFYPPVFNKQGVSRFSDFVRINQVLAYAGDLYLSGSVLDYMVCPLKELY